MTLYDIYTTRIREGDIVAYSSLSTECLRIAIIVGFYDDGDYMKVIATDVENYYKVTPKALKVKVDNVIRLERTQINHTVAQKLESELVLHKERARLRREAVIRGERLKAWGTPGRADYYVVIAAKGKEYIVDYKRTSHIKSLHQATLFTQQEGITEAMVCSVVKKKIVKIVDCNNKIREYNPEEVAFLNKKIRFLFKPSRMDYTKDPRYTNIVKMHKKLDTFSLATHYGVSTTHIRRILKQFGVKLR